MKSFQNDNMSQNNSKSYLNHNESKGKKETEQQSNSGTSISSNKDSYNKFISKIKLGYHLKNPENRCQTIILHTSLDRSYELNDSLNQNEINKDPKFDDLFKDKNYNSNNEQNNMSNYTGSELDQLLNNGFMLDNSAQNKNKRETVNQINKKYEEEKKTNNERILDINDMNKNQTEKENCIADIGPSMKEIKNEEGIKKLDVDNYYIHSPHNNLFYMNNSNNSIPKIDRYFNNNLIDTDSNMQDIENNNNANDENFFNYSFYNNKNNNKIINNNYINKLNENNEIKNNTNDQLPKYNQNFFQTNNNKNPQSQIEQPIPNFHNIQNIESYHNNSNKRNSFFSTENSNSNFRKKTKHKKQFKVRFGDWICPKCENLNFSFRNKCNRCGLSKEIGRAHV